MITFAVTNQNLWDDEFWKNCQRNIILVLTLQNSCKSKKWLQNKSDFKTWNLEFVDFFSQFFKLKYSLLIKLTFYFCISRFLFSIGSDENQTVVLKSESKTLTVKTEIVQNGISESGYLSAPAGKYK